MAHQLVPVKKIGNVQFYKFPFLEIAFTLNPENAMPDFLRVLNAWVSDDFTAAAVLQKLIDAGRKSGLQTFVFVEYPESALPEVHRLTHAVFSLPKNGDIYFTPVSGNSYESEALFRLFSL